MKKIFAYLLTAVFAYAGIWLAFIANVSDAELVGPETNMTQPRMRGITLGK